MKKILTIFSCLLVLLLLIGCGRSGLPGLVPAAGIVTFNDVPIEGATVSFAPKSGTADVRSASATTDKNGKFVASTLNYGDGMSPGEYLVFVTKTTGTGGALSSDDKSSGDDRQIINHLPSKYGSKGTSGLTVTIPAKGNKNIELKLEGEVDSTPQKPTRGSK